MPTLILIIRSPLNETCDKSTAKLRSDRDCAMKDMFAEHGIDITGEAHIEAGAAEVTMIYHIQRLQIRQVSSKEPFLLSSVF